MGTGEFDLSLTNVGATDLYTGGEILFQIRGKGVYTYDRLEVVSDLRDAGYDGDPVYPVGGIKTLSSDLYYKTDANDIIEALGSTAYWKNKSRTNPMSITLSANRDTKNMRLFMYGGTGSAIALTMANSGWPTAGEIWINGFSFEVVGKETIKWTIIPFEASNAIRTVV